MSMMSAVLLCLLLAGCGGETPDLTRDSDRVRTTEADASETGRGTEAATGGERDSTPQDGILTADPDADRYTPYY